MFEYVSKERRQLRYGTRSFAREVDVGDARIFVDHGFQWDGTRNVWLTRARASYVLGSGPTFVLKPRALLARVTGFLGGTPSGDPCFDDFFTVQTEAPEQTWAALNTRVRSLLAGSFEDAHLVSDGYMVTLWREGDHGFEADAQAAIEVVGEIVNQHAQVLLVLGHLPGASLQAPTGPWHSRQRPSVEIKCPTPVSLQPMEGTRGPVMSASAECCRSIRRFYIHVDEVGCVHGDRRRLPEHARFADGLGACEIVCDGKEVRLTWTNLDIPRERIQAGTRFVAALARQATSLYR